MNRPTTRRRSVKQAFEEDDAPAPKRTKTEMNPPAAKRATNGATKKAVKNAYDENDDGFQFTRRTSRRTAAKGQQVPEPILEEAAKPAKPIPARRKKESLAAPELAPSQSTKRRRSARLSTDKEHSDADPEPIPKAAKKVASKQQKTPAPEVEEKIKARDAQTPQPNELHVAKKRDGAATKIMLPFADTPVITRNKEMRKASKDGHRRSSTGLRGRRASSLIDSGLSNALPHSEVDVQDFYKYIEQSLPEPRRMKQLLTWCGSRALPPKPSGSVKDANAIMAARAIQQELIDDLANKPELSDWFSREDTAPTTVIKKPNPANERNLATLRELEEEVKRLEDEKAAWESLSKASILMPPPPPPSTHTPRSTISDIDASLLDPSQASILSALVQTQHQPSPSSNSFSYTTPAALQSYLSTLSVSLEPNIDILADGLHKIDQYRNTAERVADRILGTAAQRLQERERVGREKAGSEGIGVGDVLRGLAGVLNE